MSDIMVIDDDDNFINKPVEDSVIMEEKNISSITIEDSFEEEHIINENEDKIISVQFYDDEIYQMMNESISNAIKCSLKFKKIPIHVHLDQVNKIISFSKKATVDVNTSFVIDTCPTKGKVVKEMEVPSYNKTIQNVMKEKPPEPKIESIIARRRNFCFNCGEDDHQITKCTRPKNFENIKKNKKEFQARFSDVRYHTDVQQKFIPGKISDQLRRALGLRRDELPLHIYHMRKYGYPPGWLEEAKIQHSGISLIHADNVELVDSDQEEGEIEPDKTKYDINKIYDFPGFNVKPDFKYKDEADRSRYVQYMKDSDRKEKMIEKLKSRAVQGYKRKKLMKLPSSDSSNDKYIPEPEEIVAELTDNSIILENNPNDSISMATLDELEKRKQQLLLDINDSSTLSPNPSKNRLEIENSITPLSSDKSSLLNSTKFEVRGTPLLQFSPFGKLPNGDAFSIGVSDVICFENLPDSTGKYEQMKGVIGKVRKAIQKLNSEND